MEEEIFAGKIFMIWHLIVKIAKISAENFPLYGSTHNHTTEVSKYNIYIKVQTKINTCCGYIYYITDTSTAFITDGRIVFAVTKFDNYYTGSDEEELSSVETQEYVRKGLLELKFDVSLESIVPISGKWALRARQLLGDPQQSMHLLEDARKCLTYCKEKEARGEGESIDYREQVLKMEAGKVATELQKASQILDLEKRFV